MFSSFFSRRNLLKATAAGGITAGVSALVGRTGVRAQDPVPHDDPAHATGGHGGNNHTVGTVDHARNGFTPLQLATEFDYGTISTQADGSTLREFTINAVDKEIEIAPGVFSGQPLVWMLTLLTILVLMAVSQRVGPTSRWLIAAMIALGIGLHNLGEGLAIGAALASGEAALGVFLRDWLYPAQHHRGGGDCRAPCP